MDAEIPELGSGAEPADSPIWRASYKLSVTKNGMAVSNNRYHPSLTPSAWTGLPAPPCFRSQVWAELVERAIRYAYLPGSKGCFSYVPVWLYCYYMVRLHLILSPAGFSAAMHWLIHSQVSSPSHPQNKLRNKYLHLPDHLPH